MTAAQLQLNAAGDQAQYRLPDTRGYRLALATSDAEVRAVQRLRSTVLAGENPSAGMGLAHLDPADERADERSDHLMVWYCGDAGSPLRTGDRRTAVATVRLLPPHANDAAPRGTGLEAGRRFGLMPLEDILDGTVEVGPACVDVDHRGGTAAALLLTGVARYLRLTGYRAAIGCAPVDLRDGGVAAAACWDLARRGHLAPAQRRCRALVPLPLGGLDRAHNSVVPPVLSALFRWGGVLCGPPALDKKRCAAEFLVLLDLQMADPRYARRFLGPLDGM